MKTLFFITALSFAFGCTKTVQTSFDKETAKAEMKTLMTTYLSDLERKDVNAVINHFYNNPDFHVYSDGLDFTYDEMKDVVKTQWYKGVKTVTVKCDSMKFHVFSPNQAHCFIKGIETFTDSTDRQSKVAIEVSFYGIKDSGQWKIAYAHAYHKEIN
jgi:hypothetical protein